MTPKLVPSWPRSFFLWGGGGFVGWIGEKAISSANCNRQSLRVSASTPDLSPMVNLGTGLRNTGKRVKFFFFCNSRSNSSPQVHQETLDKSVYQFQIYPWSKVHFVDWIGLLAVLVDLWTSQSLGNTQHLKINWMEHSFHATAVPHIDFFFLLVWIVTWVITIPHQWTLDLFVPCV